jgi:diaminohydroxyphosphoribosylaminopyrimidine deaminase/5-amino-6-(5-phosphoribosylamino)uracil reductase
MAESMQDTDVKFMKEALRQARKGLGRTSPNPAVGAVIVRKGKIIAKGHHRKAGLPHAEVEVLGALGGKAPGATLYVTLEPCNHHGRTPPCTEAILRSGLKRVVVGMRDPNPDVKGGGCEYLKEKGLSVTTGVLEAECRRLNEAFLKFVTTGRPFVMVKSALTMDGWTGTAKGHSKWITNEKSRKFVHRLRDRVDAVLVGIGTVLSDDPLLTARLGHRSGHDPLRIIVDTHLRIPAKARVLNHNSSAETIVVAGAGISSKNLKQFQKNGVSVITCPVKSGRIDLVALMGILGERFITSLLVEGGASIIGSMLREKLIDKFFIFKAPKILGGEDGIPMAAGRGPDKVDQCLCLKDLEVRRFGGDILFTAYPDYKCGNDQ